jgi:threonine dehydratase
MQNLPGFIDVEQAHRRISSFVHHTPVLSSSGINEIMDASIVFKCENFQKVGAFKYRGATNAVLSLSDEEAFRGVATHSSGNHAAALALAAAKRGIPCNVVMPRTAPLPKIEAVRHYGAKITFCEPTLQSRETTLKSIMDQSGAVMIHPYDNFNVICGQGTAAKELLEEIPGLDMVLAPVGGGGLLSGTSLSAKSMNENI